MKGNETESQKAWDFYQFAHLQALLIIQETVEH